MDEQPRGTVLSGYRILDLTDEKGMLSTRLLADMGDEVISAGDRSSDKRGRHLNIGVSLHKVYGK